MTDFRTPDRRIDAYFRSAQPDLPERAFDAVRAEIERTRQDAVIGPVHLRVPATGARFLLAAAAVLAVALVSISVRPGGGPGGEPTPTVSPSPTPATAATPVHTALPGSTAPTTPTRFTSPLYGYSVTVPAGWFTAEALVRWDGTRQPGPDADTDRFGGPGQLTMWAFAAPFTGDLNALVADRIAATARDHADTCHGVEPGVNEPLRVGSRAWRLIGWNCGALIYAAVTIDGGVAYVVDFRDLAVRAATDPSDRALFVSILETVELPS